MINELAGCLFDNYYYVFPSNVLTSSIKAGSACTEMALINQKRFVVAREPDTHSTLNSSTIKKITGGAKLAARVI